MQGTTAYRAQFTGSGSEYFRIAAVNFFLVAITASLYRPWAKVRRLQFFSRNTQIAGAGFDYHANPWAIFKGQMIVLVLVVIANLNPMLSGVALLIGLALFPWVLQRSIGFRMRNTSYRNLRFDFEAPVKVFYGVTGIVVLLTLLASGVVWLFLAGREPNQEINPGVFVAVIFGLSLLLSPIILLLVTASIRFKSIGYTLWGTKRFSSELDSKNMIKLGAFVAALLLVIIGGALVLAAFSSVLKMTTAVNTALTIAFFAAIVFFSGFKALIAARVHNLAWNDTKLGDDYFTSDLSEIGYALTAVWVLVLTVVTFGFYRAFGAVKLARMQVESVVVHAHQSLEDAEANATPSDIAAFGQEAADWFDIDISL